MKTAAVFFADGFEEIEALSPVDYLRRAGIEVYTVAVPSPTTQDPYIVTGSHKVPVIADLTLEEYLDSCKDGTPDCVVCPGGMPGASNLAASKALLKHLEECFDEGKLVGALCASPAVVLGNTKILTGKKWTCYPEMQNNAKPEYLENYSNEVFISDGNLVTGRGPGASEQFAMELVSIMCGNEISKKVHDASQQR